jgi:hypothetical protein
MAHAGDATGGLGAASAEPSTSTGHRMMLNAGKSILQLAKACNHQREAGLLSILIESQRLTYGRFGNKPRHHP